MNTWTVDACEDANGFSTLRVFDGTDHGDTSQEPIATVYIEENAQRIVACVNACEGIDTDAIPEVQRVGGFSAVLTVLDNVKSERDHLRAVNAKLLAALRELVERAEAAFEIDGLPEYDQARAAIAKAEGQP